MEVESVDNDYVVQGTTYLSDGVYSEKTLHRGTLEDCENVMFMSGGGMFIDMYICKYSDLEEDGEFDDEFDDD